MPMQLRWEIARPLPASDALAQALGLDPIVAQVLTARGYASAGPARQFLEAPLDSLQNPDAIVDVAVAAERIIHALRHHEPIAIYGDYDADGISATSILLRGLRALGADVSFYIPSRFTEGYGLNDAALQRLAETGRRLVVSVDCGVTATGEITRARQRELDVIVVDHHEPGPVLPPAAAVVDPKRHDAGSSFKEYSAAGLAFQVLRAVRRRLEQPEMPEELLDLAALGTIADVVSLVEDNRIIARWGLQRMRTAPCLGLTALIKVAGLSGDVSARHVGFSLAPRLNAAGRLGDAAVGVTLLTTDDAAEADAIAAQLDRENQRRRALCDQILVQAIEQVESARLQEGPAIVLASEGWHPGVIGIVASQLVERYYRPVVLMAVEGGTAKGSARSIERFHLVDALAQCTDLLDRFGGHAMAAGLTANAERLPEFSERFRAVAATRLTPQDLVPVLHVDAEVSLPAVTEALSEQLQRLAPFGMGNREPVFATRGLTAVTTRVMGDGQHLRLGVTDGHALAEAVGFRLGDASELLAFTRAKVDLAYTVGLDRWNDRVRVQLVVADLVTPGLNLEEVLTDGRLLVERLFARPADYISEDALGLEDAGAFHTKVAGVTFEGRQETVQALRPGDALMLRREPDNPHDPHAVKVVTASGTQIGYLSARVASRLAPSIDSGARYAAAVSQITGGGERSYGVNIYVHRHDAPPDEPDPGQALRLAWSGLDADTIVERVRVHLHRGRPLREAQRATIQTMLNGRPVRAVFGPGRGRRAVMEITAAAWVLAGRGPVVIMVPLQSQVDRWYERLAPRAREIGVRCGRAHGALRFRQRQQLLQALQGGVVDVLVASVEYLKNIETGGEAAPVGQRLRPSLLLAECEPTIEENVLDGVAQALGNPLRGCFQGGAFPAESLPGLASVETITDPFLRINLRLVDRRGVHDRDSTLFAEGQEKTLLYTGGRAAAVDLAARLRERNAGQVAYYHGGLPLRVREVLEQQFADGKIRVLVAADGFTADAAPADIRQAIIAGLPAHRGDLLEVIGSAGLDGRQATVTLLYRRDDLPPVAAALAERHPDREALAAIYRIVRGEVERAGTAAWPDDALNNALQQEGIVPRAIGIGLDILTEAGVIQREYDGDRWRITLSGQERRDLLTSLRYAEGRREAEALQELGRWAFAPLPTILKAVAGPTAGTGDQGPGTSKETG
ncbi:MAG: single-stranded-DNA-specific exonuclease RecJ [Bacillati bacterium ANGP1]|uniref:Single-stranded-DNA-specific exonuclease RecJ n=1 Tax=Candidatus Segetimicrobium genomatis TaxID=2569760 RepID=A0A537IXS2_9BACT|nr:MAG: single-stranded-DNA-specific exonuclease RecJ [Terrabacteria group bacterium ANGP1]